MNAATPTTLQPDRITNTSTDQPGITSQRNASLNTRVAACARAAYDVIPKPHSLAAPGAAVDVVQDDDQGGTISGPLIVPPEDVENTGVSDEQPVVKDEVCVQTDTDSRDVVKTKERRALIRKLRAENPDATDAAIAAMVDVQADDQSGTVNQCFTVPPPDDEPSSVYDGPDDGPSVRPACPKSH